MTLSCVSICVCRRLSTAHLLQSSSSSSSLKALQNLNGSSSLRTLQSLNDLRLSESNDLERPERVEGERSWFPSALLRVNSQLTMSGESETLSGAEELSMRAIWVAVGSPMPCRGGCEGTPKLSLRGPPSAGRRQCRLWRVAIWVGWLGLCAQTPTYRQDQGALMVMCPDAAHQW